MTVNTQMSVSTIQQGACNNIQSGVLLGIQLYCDAAQSRFEKADGSTIQLHERFTMYLYYDSEQTSFEEVAGICPNKDDPNMSYLTIRSLIIGLIFGFSMSFYYMWYYVTNLYAVILPVITPLMAHPIGKIWARISGCPYGQ
jgi:hypothetical protein